MTGYLIDSNVLIDHLRGRQHITEYIHRLYMTADPVYTSVVCLAEIFTNHYSEEQDAVDEVFHYIVPLPVTMDLARHGGRYLQKFRKTHGLTLPDALVAATASINGLTLITSNTKHFPMPDLKTQKPGT